LLIKDANCLTEKQLVHTHLAYLALKLVGKKIGFIYVLSIFVD